MGEVWPIVTMAAALLSALLVVRRYLRPRGLVERSLAVLVLFVAFHLLPIHILAGAELAGLIEAISFPMIAALGIAGLAAILFGPRPLGASATGAADLRAGPGVRILLATLRRDHTGAIIAICAASWLVFTVNTVVSYAFGWDGLTYHLPLAVRWLQDQSLAIPMRETWKYGLPANGDVGMMVLLAAGLQRFAFLFNMLAFAIAALSVYLLSRRLSSGWRAAVLSVALFAMLPFVQFQAVSGYVDLYGTAFIVAGIAMLAWRNEPSGDAAAPRQYLNTLVLVGLAWGVAAGSKHVYYAYGALCFLAAVAIIWVERPRHGRSPVLLAAVLGGCMLLPSAFWVIRATALTGNPVYPVGVSLLGYQFFEGVPMVHLTASAAELLFVKSTSEWLTYPWVEFKRFGYAYGAGNGVGAAWTTFMPAALSYAVVFVVQSPRADRARVCLAILLTVIVMAALWWFGLQRLPRFGFPFMVLSCVLAVPVFDLMIAHRPRLFAVLLLLSFGATAILSTFVPAHQLLGRLRDNTWNRAAVFEMPDIIDRLPEGAVVWNAGAEEIRNFALSGAGLTNRVVHLRYFRWTDAEAAKDLIDLYSVDFAVERIPFCCDGLERLGARQVFAGRVGPTHLWRVWAVSPRALAWADTLASDAKEP